MNGFLLHDKVLEGNMPQVMMAIAQCKNIDELDNFGYSALHWAVINRQVDIVKLLLEAGADVNVRSADGLTPYRNAIDLDFAEIEQLLSFYKDGLLPLRIF